jgi:hypothetical protein
MSGALAMDCAELGATARRYEDWLDTLSRSAPHAGWFVRMHAAACLANLRNPPDALLILADAIDETCDTIAMQPDRRTDLRHIATLLRDQAPLRAALD